MQQVYFADELEGVQERWLQTSFGSVYSITAGKIGQPLILVVHGSGPKNSSQQYRGLLQEYLVRVSYVEKFYIVGIDCPGYGRSKGSKEAVKTFPLRLFSQLLQALQYRSYFAMFGHSQGGAAIFNAVFQAPLLTQFMVMDRPVCGNIQRFRQFSVPTLLIYNIEDDGHPIWQGKLLMKELKRAQFHSYRSSINPYWAEDHVWDLMLAFFYNNRNKKIQNNRRPTHSEQKFNLKKQKSYQKTTRNYSNQKKVPFISKNIIVPIEQIPKYQSISICSSEERKQGMSICSEIKKKLNYQKYLFEKQEQQQKINLFQSVEIQMKQEKEIVYFHENQKNTDGEQKLKNQTAIQKRIEDSKKQNFCAICMQTYYRPEQTNCHHIFCQKCLGESMLIRDTCPMCRQKITKRAQKHQLHAQIISSMSSQQIQKRQNLLKYFQMMLRSIVKIQIGNNSTEIKTKQSIFTKTKKKYNWQIYVKQPRNFPLEQVSFNINMQQPNSKPIRVRNAPFTFQARGTFSFSCKITIKPKSKEYAQQVSIYRINVEPGNHSEIISIRKKCFIK